MQKALVACAVLLCPLAVGAQNFILTSPQAATVTTTTAVPQIFIGADTCKTEVLNFHWDMTAEQEPATGQIINIVKARSSGTCGTTTATGVVAPDSLNVAQEQTATGDDSVTAQSMILDLSDAGLPGGCDNRTTTSATPWTTFYCVQLSSNSAVSGSSVLFQDIQINFATAPPTAPDSLDIEPGDGHLKVFWSPGNSGENIASYRVHVLAIGQADIDDTKGTSIQAPQLNADVSQTDDGAQLQDDVAYNVVIRATDQYGNLSEPSGAVPGTPIHILDFYGLYRTDGGRATGGGGCSSPGPATWIAVLALLTALFARRRKKTRNGALLVAFVTVLAPKAQAAGYERPKRFLLVALKVDRYDPKVDSEAGLTANPYHQIFGPRAPLRYQLEVDWEAWHPYGSLLFGVTAGYWQNFGKGLVADTRAKSQDTALLDVVPIGLIATYRFDQLADMWPRFPVIPYAQAGVMRALWASFNGTGSVSKDANGGSGKGSGWTWGYTTALGVAFALDAIDPDLSREAYQDTGIQRSSIFAEYGWTRLDGFHNNTSLILSDRAWRFGVAMEF